MSTMSLNKDSHGKATETLRHFGQSVKASILVAGYGHIIF
jgi:hypothetical protein